MPTVLNVPHHAACRLGVSKQKWTDEEEKALRAGVDKCCPKPWHLCNETCYRLQESSLLLYMHVFEERHLTLV